MSCAVICMRGWGNSNFLISQVVSRNVIAVLDIDSRNLNEFDETDRESLEKITGLIHID